MESISMNATVSLPGSSGARRARSASSSRLTFSSCSTFPQVKERRNDPSVDGARIPPNSAGIAPCRSRSMSSMLSAPAIIPATRHGTFSCAFTPHRAINPDMLCDQAAQARPLRQGHHRDQARPRHEIRVIKRRVDLRQPVQQSHLRGVLSCSTTVASATPIVPAQRAPFASTRPNEPLFTRWIEA